MPRKRKAPDPSRYDSQIERLWLWLVKHAGATPSRDPAMRFGEATAIMAAANNSPTDRRAAVARSFSHFSAVKQERTHLPYVHGFRVEAVDEAQQALGLLTRVEKRLTAFAGQARATRGPTVPGIHHWPSDVATLLEAKLPAWGAALYLIVDFAQTIHARIAEHSLDADTMRTVVDNFDNAALNLADAGIRYSEIAELLDDQRMGNDPRFRRAMALRWKKRVARAREKLRGNKTGDISARVELSPPPPPSAPHSRSHEGRQQRRRKERTRSGPRRS